MSERLPGRFIVALGCQGRVRVMAAVLPGPADELRERHELQRTSAILAAEGLVASTLLASHVKGEERLTINVRATRPEFTFLADINGDGTLRARFSPTRTHPLKRFSGTLMALKSLGPRELYRGIADVQDERFEGALQRYLTTSQQVDARVRIEAEVDAAGRVTFASGLLVERLPEMDPETFSAWFDTPLRQDFKGLMTGFAFGLLAGEPVEVLGSQDFVYRCSCDAERVRTMLRALGPEEVRQIHAEQGHAEVTCHYCNTRYEVPGEELVRLFDPPAD